MVKTLKWVPGAVTAGVPFDLPAGSPGIVRIAGAYLLRAMGQSIGNHTQAQIIASVDNHAVHGHDITTVPAFGGGAALTEPAIAGPVEGVAGIQINVGAVDALAAAQAHAATAVDVVNTLAATATPVVAATLTRVDRDTISCNVNILAGDVVVMRYVQEGFAIQS